MPYNKSTLYKTLTNVDCGVSCIVHVLGEPGRAPCLVKVPLKAYTTSQTRIQDAGFMGTRMFACRLITQEACRDMGSLRNLSNGIGFNASRDYRPPREMRTYERIVFGVLDVIEPPSGIQLMRKRRVRVPLRVPNCDSLNFGSS